jgi:hypothetical protein
MNAAGVGDFEVSITANSSTDLAAWSSTSVTALFMNDWLGDATNTIPGCYMYNAGRFVDIAKGLTDGTLTAAALHITAASSTFTIDLTNLGSTETASSTLPSWVFEVKTWLWGLYFFILMVGLCWYVLHDITGVTFEHNEEML